MMKSILKKVVVVFLLVVSVGAFAVDPPPVAMLKNTSDQILSELDKKRQGGNLKHEEVWVRGVVRRLLVPHVDMQGMSQAVVGRYWQNGSLQSQRQFMEQFSNYVIKTYAAAFASYDGETMTFYPIRGYDPNQQRVQVNSQLNRKEGPAINVQYRVVNKGGNWLIYDFSVDNVSLVQNYRDQFSADLQRGGLDLLVKKLLEKNRGK
jgi:phospholipid transport system substrate-binding protein